MPSRLDTLIVLVTLAAGAAAFEARNRSEIAPSPNAHINPETSSTSCDAATEYQAYRERRMILMAFGIPDQPDYGRRLQSAALSCEDR
jgi:hypothetical protein